MSEGSMADRLRAILDDDEASREHRELAAQLLQEPEPSEFGRGVVVCLAKFSEHLWGGSAYDEQMIWTYNRWLEKSPEQRASLKAEMEQYPHGQAAREWMEVQSCLVTESVHGEGEKTLSHLIEMWMNAASDHLYDLDEDLAPQPLKDLADLALQIGHGFTGKTWTMEDAKRIRELWKESCIAVDRMLGVAKPDWGRW